VRIASHFFARRWTRALPVAAILASPSIAAAQHSGAPHGIPDFCAGTTITSVGSGNWTDPSRWSPARVPGAGDVVVVAGGTTLSYDMSSSDGRSNAAIKAICLDGTVQFRTDISTRLTFVTMRVRDAGALEIGTQAQPVAVGATAEIVIANAPLDTVNDPEQWGNGLIGEGRVTMHGSIKSPTFVRLTQEVAAGQGSLQIASGVAGWQTGDKLVLPDSKQWAIESYPYTEQWETPLLSNAAGTSLALTAATQFPHPGARDANDVLNFLPHVGNLSRNVIVRSEAPTGVRGHILFNYRANVDIRYALLKDLGRTTIQLLDSTTLDSGNHATHVGSNQIGRYSLHMHHVFGPTTTPANGYQFTLIGNAIDGGTKWGITVHNSHYGLISDNVIYDADGVGIMTEDGSESYNVFERNFVVRSRGTGDERGDARKNNGEYGFEGSAFWFRGPNNYVRDNVGANSNSFGYTVLSSDLGQVHIPKFKGADTTVAGQYDLKDIQATPLLEFARNELYASVDGLTIWDVGAVCCTQVRETPESVVRDFHIWHVSRYGYYGYGQNRITYEGWVQRGDRNILANHYESNLGLWFGDYITRNLVIHNADIQGMRIGIRAPYKVGDVADIYGNQPGTMRISDSFLRNQYNVAVSPMFAVTGGGSGLVPRRTYIDNVRFQTLPGDVGGGAQYAIAMAFDVDTRNANIVQLDQVFVTNFNGIVGQNFQTFYAEQAPNFIVPQTATGLQGAPVPGLTNSQLFSQYGIAIAGAIAPCLTTRPDVQGFACTGTVTPPAPPANLRLTATQN
jgi:hypothetical protein